MPIPEDWTPSGPNCSCDDAYAQIAYRLDQLLAQQIRLADAAEASNVIQESIADSLEAIATFLPNLILRHAVLTGLVTNTKSWDNIQAYARESGKSVGQVLYEKEANIVIDLSEDD